MTWSQSKNNDEELILLTKTKHDALRKDIEDYKKLLIKYQSDKIEYDILLADLERQSKTTEKTFEELKRSNERASYLESELETTRFKVANLNEKLASLDGDYRKLNMLYYQEKNKVYHMKKDQLQVDAWRGAAIVFFLMIFIVAANN